MDVENGIKENAGIFYLGVTMPGVRNCFKAKLKKYFIKQLFIFHGKVDEMKLSKFGFQIYSYKILPKLCQICFKSKIFL